MTSTSDAIKLEFDSKQPAWMGFGICKALWVGEESHRLEMTGLSGHTGTSTEERECYAALLSNYLTLREKGTTPPDSGLDEALTITKDGMAEELLVYEVLSRMNGNVVALLPDGEVTRLEAFIRKYVLVDADQPAPESQPEAPSAPPNDPHAATTTAHR